MNEELSNVTFDRCLLPLRISASVFLADDVCADGALRTATRMSVPIGKTRDSMLELVCDRCHVNGESRTLRETRDYRKSIRSRIPSSLSSSRSSKTARFI